MQLLRIDFSRCSLPQVVLDEHKISRESKPPTQVDNPKQGLWISHKVLVTTVPNRRKIQIIWSLWTNHCTPCWRLCWPTTPTNTGFSPRSSKTSLWICLWVPKLKKTGEWLKFGVWKLGSREKTLWKLTGSEFHWLMNKFWQQWSFGDWFWNLVSNSIPNKWKEERHQRA